jgi:hypothetical protein
MFPRRRNIILGHTHIPYFYPLPLILLVLHPHAPVSSPIHIPVSCLPFIRSFPFISGQYQYSLAIVAFATDFTMVALSPLSPTLPPSCPLQVQAVLSFLSINLLPNHDMTTGHSFGERATRRDNKSYFGYSLSRLEKCSLTHSDHHRKAYAEIFSAQTELRTYYGRIPG